jgi:hypothetical protein
METTIEKLRETLNEDDFNRVTTLANETFGENSQLTERYYQSVLDGDTAVTETLTTEDQVDLIREHIETAEDKKTTIHDDIIMGSVDIKVPEIKTLLLEYRDILVEIQNESLAEA